MDHAVVAAERDGEAWWIVMRDVSSELLDEATPLTREQNRFVLSAAAAMWEEFWDDAPAVAASQRDRLSFSSLAVAERERDGLDLLPKQFDAAWEAFAEAVDADVADAVLDLLDDPQRLSDALEQRGVTLCHGDLRDENMGLRDGTLVLLDWGLATRGHPAVELAWYLVHDVWRIAATHDEVVEDYRAALGERDDPLALELGLISGLDAVRLDLRPQRGCAHGPARKRMGPRGARLVGAAREAGTGRMEVADARLQHQAARGDP